MRFHSLACAALLAFASWPTQATTNFVSGTIGNSVTLSGTNWLSGTVVITNGAVVTISPGARLLMNTNATLLVYGQLLAEGTSNAPITFTRATTTAPWSRIKFIRAQDSAFRHCVVEFANSAGDHQNYYDNDCNTNTPPLARNYHEAVVALATHLDFENCLFRNLPSTASNGEGDAIAIIADDVEFPGTASARVINCQFTGIGQAIHTRFSFVLVEGCVFSSKRGDNDDIDLYGESFPPALVRNNLFLSGVEDKINPTRCSAIIMNNLFLNGPDHGVVLRDKCYPIVVNNIFSNFTAAALSVQNQCDALIANNTIVNSGRGVRMFDHTGRHGPPYCLTPGNGKATLVNNIIRNTPSGAITMEQSSFTPHPHVTVINCNIQGGQGSIVRSGSNGGADATVVWGPGNIDADPQFTTGLRLSAGSPCIDAGTNAMALVSSNWSASVTNDYYGMPRPLDGNGDGTAQYDIGAHEFLLPSADSNGDGIPDGWALTFGFSPLDNSVSTNDVDGDRMTTWAEFVAGTNPTNATSLLDVHWSTSEAAVLNFVAQSNVSYTVQWRTNLTSAMWMNLTNIAANPQVRAIAVDTTALPASGENYFRIVTPQVP